MGYKRETMLYLVWIILKLYLFKQSYSDNNICSLCTCSGTIVDCNHRNLTYIPKLPSNTTRLYFNGNNISKITKKTLRNMTNSRLSVLELDNNNIHRISRHNNLYNLLHLTNLSLSYNPLNQKSIFYLFANLQNLAINLLNLTQVLYLEEMPDPLFIHNLTITRLELSFNSLLKLKLKTLEGLGIQELILSHNHLGLNPYFISPLPELRYFSLRNNSFSMWTYMIPVLCSENYFPNLEYLDISDNGLELEVTEELNCARNLSTLLLKSNEIDKIGYNSFRKLYAMKTLDLSFQRGSKPKVYDQAFVTSEIDIFQQNITIIESNNLEELHLDGAEVAPDALQGCMKLTTLTMSYTEFCGDVKSCPEIDTILSSVPALQILNLSHTNLYFIPQSIRDLHHLKILDVSFNKISSWTDGFWEAHKKLTNLLLNENQIKHPTDSMFSVTLRQNVRKINMANNPTECLCDNLGFVEWIHEEAYKFVDYPEGYKCLHMTQLSCLLENPLYTSIFGVGSILLIALIVMALVYKYRWRLKYQIYIWRHKPKIIKNMAEREYIYDVFVSYCGEDGDWVNDYLVPNLEENEKMKLCIHERDFMAGKMIIDNIVEAIENSRYVLIVLSNKFAQSEWCQFELTLAQKHVLNLYIEPLTVVLLEDIRNKYMTNSLRALLQTTTYLTWDEDPHHQQLFLQRLKTAFTVTH